MKLIRLLPFESCSNHKVSPQCVPHGTYWNPYTVCFGINTLFVAFTSRMLSSVTIHCSKNVIPFTQLGGLESVISSNIATSIDTLPSKLSQLWKG